MPVRPPEKSSPPGPEAEESLVECLRETDLESFERKLCVELQLTRLEHFDHVDDGELNALAGLSLPAIRRLRTAIDEKRKNKKKIRNLFGTLGKTKEKTLPKTVVNVDRVRRESKESTETCLIAKEKIKLQEKLGEGSFAVVKRAIWEQENGKKTHVAVKLLRDSEAGLAEELELEINNMHRLRHPNLIRLHGLVFSKPIMMVVELCEGGALLDRLRDTAKSVILATQLMDFSVQIAKGMAYLETKRFIHRDLAARNVLLTADERHVKIGDFGLMRALPDKDEHYVMSAQKKVPFAWCPPESLRRRQFSHASDVWSFGVTLWEIFTYGEEPWCGFRGPEILQKLANGERLPEPACCPVALYQLMQQCWALDPEQRPRFLALKELVKELQLSLGECREPQTGEGFLELCVGDQIIVIKGSPEHYHWHGQNVRTRKYGQFARRILVFRCAASQRHDISKPISGSFIHAGHGDARGGESWGQPDKIDALYLKNPMPLVDTGPPTAASAVLMRASVPETVPSIMDLKSNRKSAPPLRPPPPANKPRSAELQRKTNYGSTPYEPDPFAPFDDFEDRLYEAARNQPQLYDSPPVNDFYDQTGFSGSIGAGSSNGSEHSSVPDDPNPKPASARTASPPVAAVSLAAPPATARPVSYAGFVPKPLTERKTSAPIEADPFEVPTSVKQLATRPRYSQVYHDPAKISAQLSTSPLYPEQSFSRSFAPPVERPRPSFDSTNQQAQPMGMANGISVQRPRPSFDYTNQQALAMANGISVQRPRPLFDVSNQRQTQMAPGPMSTGQLVRQLSNQLQSMSAGYGSSITPPPSYSTATQMPSSVPLVSLAGPRNAVPWGVNLQSQPIYGTIAPNTFNQTQTRTGLSPTMGLTTSTLETQSRLHSQSVPNMIKAKPQPEVLDLFDPLTSKPSVDLVQQVIDLAPFCSKERCAVVLRRCKMDVGQAVRELKVEKLVDMGLVPSRSAAQQALCKHDWDMNATCDALFQ